MNYVSRIRDVAKRVPLAAVALGCLAGCAAPQGSVTQLPSSSAVGAQRDESVRFLRPAHGPTLARFDGNRNKGLDIGGAEGDPILAAGSGQVVYAGAGLRGYGNLIILKHDQTFLTAYAHNRSLFVDEGDQVRAGQKIAEMGSTDTNRVKLHFEVRRKGAPVDPEPYLHAGGALSFDAPSPGAKAGAGSVGRSGASSTVSTGSGFAVTATQVVTNAHVVEGCARIEVADRGLAQIHAIDAGNDLALLTVPQALSSVALSQGRIRQGDTVTVVGYPLRGILAQGVQVTTGNVTALAGPKNNTGIFQISAPVQPGNSGGPVVDASGNVVGVVVSKLNALRAVALTGDIPQNINFAVSLLTLRSFLEAYGVEYRTANSTKNLSVADAADAVKPLTMLIKCHPQP